jgi:hypothetical protein
MYRQQFIMLLLMPISRSSSKHIQNKLAAYSTADNSEEGNNLPKEKLVKE